MKPGGLYRNKKQVDVDFYCSAVKSDVACGLWVSRQTRRMVSVDEISLARIRPEDWEEVPWGLHPDEIGAPEYPEPLPLKKPTKKKPRKRA